MGIQTFEYCSLSYLNLWSENDKSCTNYLSSDNKEKKLIALKYAANIYRVARNLQTKYDIGIGLERFEPVLNILDNVNINDLKKEPILEVRRIGDLISKEYGNRGVLSLTTKFLWLKLKSPILIYDSQAQKALGTKVGDLEGFYEKWHSEFKLHEAKISNACFQLEAMYPYMKISKTKITKEEVKKISSEKWFRERVFDIYLWNKG